MTEETMTTRPSLYRDIHKAIRAMMGHLLDHASRCDFDEGHAVTSLRDETVRTFMLLESHAEHEDQHVAPLVAQHAPDVARMLAREHEAQAERMVGLLALLDRRAPDASGGGHAFVVALSRFLAEVQAHMADEEELAMPAIWAALDDATILATEHALVTSIPPGEMMQWMRWFLPALPARDRDAMLAGMKQGAPPEAFAATIQLAREVLPESELPALERLAA
jgi:hemerythrin-like domain-containing protein